MNQLHTERELRFIGLAAELADDFAQRAARHDEEESFPHENYARLRESGYSIMTIPEELGGMGATLLERMKAQERLGQGCGATALAINMHLNVTGLLIESWRMSKDPKIEAKLRQIAKDRSICGGSASEPNNNIPVLRPKALARRTDGGFLVNGNKIFSTQSIALDFYFSEATWEDAPNGPTIITFYIPRETPGLSFKDDWHTMGMRASASRSSELKDAFVPDSAVMIQRPVFTRGGITNAFLQAPFTIAAPYVGIAIAARDFVVNFMRDRTRYPAKEPLSHSPAVYNKVGEMEVLIEGARAAMWQVARDINSDQPRNWARRSVAARMIAIENSVRVVDLALRSVGGASYFRRLPLERYHRDMRAALYHPFDSDDTLEFLGKSAFGIPVLDRDSI